MEGLSLDQFAVFVAIVDEGSFSAAAKRLGRAQSAVTYAIQKLEQQSGDIALFDRSAYRPTLTSAGHALLPTARRLLQDVTRFRSQALNLVSGLESEVRIVADVLAPLGRVYAVLASFAERYPHVALRLMTDFHDNAAKAAGEKRVDLAIIGEVPAKMMGLKFVVFDELQFIVVAAPHHELAKATAPLNPEVLGNYLQLVLDSRSNLFGSREYGVVSEQRWYLTDLATKLDLLIAGTGWGSMPRHAVESCLADGRLVELRVTSWDGGDRMPRMAMAIAHHPDRLPGPAGQWLMAGLAGEKFA